MFEPSPRSFRWARFGVLVMLVCAPLGCDKATAETPKQAAVVSTDPPKPDAPKPDAPKPDAASAM